MQVRSLHFSDFLKLGRMHQANIGLNLPYALVLPDIPLPAALAQHLPVNSFNSSVYIYEEKGKPQAFVQSRARQRRDEWEILTLGVVGNIQPEAVATGDIPPSEVELHTGDLSSAEVSEAEGDGTTLTAQAVQIEQQEPSQEEVDPESDSTLLLSWPEETEIAWQRLLEHMVVDAGEKGVVRVYARLAVDSPQFILFSQLGFHAYTHETLFHLNYQLPVERPPETFKLKEQRNRDAWYIHQLYSTITPSFVQNSEQNTSRSWEIHRSYLPRSAKETGWLLMEAEKAAAYIRILSSRNRHLLWIMNLDTRRELLPDLIRYALSTLKAGADTHVYCIVREYQVEQEAMLEDAGFVRVFGKQAVLVKHTVQYIRATERQLARGREGILELARTRPATRIVH